MPIQFPCSQCEKTLTAAEDAVGQPVICINCGKVTHVPDLPLVTEPSAFKDSSLDKNEEPLSTCKVQTVQEFTPPVSLRQIESQTGWAIIVALSSMPLGIFGMIFGSMAKAQFQAGNYSVAEIYYKKAKLWTTLGMALWLVIFLVLVFGIIIPKLTGLQ